MLRNPSYFDLNLTLDAQIGYGEGHLLKCRGRARLGGHPMATGQIIRGWIRVELGLGFFLVRKKMNMVGG